MRHAPLLVLLAGVAQAQTGTEIYVARLSRSGDALTVAAPANVTNRAGYDNQPSFTPDGRAILFTSIREGRPADIYRYDLASRATARLTHTAESEYSPTVTPDGTHFSVIRVETDSTQRLWKFRLDGSAPELVLTGVKPVGYHAWGNDNLLGLFVLGNPATLQVADTRTGTATVVAERIGRSLHRVPGREAISFLHRTGPEPYYIKAMDLGSRTIRAVAPAPEGSEFHAWLPDGTLIVGLGSKLLTWAPAGGRWVEIADLAAHGVTEISRLAVSPDGGMLAIVAEDQAGR
jgi:dipeptidyl aminopeptidase/acylaminoacyl peptidase